MIEKLLYSYIDNYKDILLKQKKIAVAVSGGIDSMALMFIAKMWCDNNNVQLFVLTVDHGLRKESKLEAEYVAKICKNNSIIHNILTWEGEKPQNNVESIAREKRYELISNFCKDNNINTLLVAHHLQDQAETFFIRLFRGSGIDGLSAMHDINIMYGINIVRPFLMVFKEDLKKYLEEKNIKWIEDPSNNDEKYLRNKIRIFLNSFDNKKEILERINSAVENINDSRKYIDLILAKIEKNIVNFNSFGTCLIDKDKLLKQDPIIALRILSKIAMKISGNIYKPRFKKLKRLLEVIKETNNSLKYTFYGCIFENYKDNLLIVYREYNAIMENKMLIFNKEIIWDNRFSIKLTKDIKNLYISHVNNGDFKKILNNIKNNNIEKYREMKNIKGIEKNIFYTLPIVKNDDEYLLDCDFVEINLI